MHSFIKKLMTGSVFLATLVCFSDRILAANAGYGSSRILPGVGTGAPGIIAAWLEEDTNGILHVWGGTGSLESTSLTSATDISLGYFNGGVSNFSAPVLATNVNGDALIVWEMTDANGNGWVGGVTLPFGGDWNYNGSTTPAFNPISILDENAAFYDDQPKIDANGNVFVMWTSFSSITSESQVRGATGTVTTSFNTPFTLSTP